MWKADEGPARSGRGLTLCFLPVFIKLSVEPNGGLFVAGLLAIIFGAGWQEERSRKHRRKGHLKVKIAGYEFDAGGSEGFILVAFGVFLVAISYLVPG